MTLRTRTFSILVAVAIPAFAARPEVCDIEAAKEWCDVSSLDRIEGIWEYPEDNVTVLIRKADHEPYAYGIDVVEADDCKTVPGERIGEVYLTAQPERFRILLFTGRKNRVLCRPKECAATLMADDCGLAVAAKKRNWTFNPFALLPHFWRLARTSVTDPVKSLPVGMRKIYPSYDGNGSSRFSVRYL